MPLTKTGSKVLASMREQYGEKKGEAVFYASINKGKKGSKKWHKKKSYSHEQVSMARRMNKK